MDQTRHDLEGGKRMRPVREVAHAAIIFAAVVLVLLGPDQASAYVDPGTTGMLSQLLYVLFYGAIAMFLYFLRCIKENVTNAKRFMAKLFGG